MKYILKVFSATFMSLILSFSIANASSGVFKVSHDLGFGKDTNLDAITKAVSYTHLTLPTMMSV